MARGILYEQSEIRSNILERRKELGLTQAYVAERLDVSRSTYTLMERGYRKITVEELVKLAAILDTSTDYLLYGELASDIGLFVDDPEPFYGEFSKLSEEDQAEIMNAIRYKLEKKGNKNGK